MASADNNIYFIITADPPSPNVYIKAGEICFIYKERFNARQKRNDTDVLPVVRVGKSTDIWLDKVLLQPLSRREADLLMALESNEDRLLTLKDPEALEKASNLSEGGQVHVEYKGQWLKGVIRYIGSLTSYSSDPITGVFFGVELQGEDKGKGQNDGSYYHKTYFTCPKNSGIFAPFTRIKPVDHKPSAPTLPTQSSLSMTSTEPLKAGDRVTFFGDKNAHHGMVMDIKDHPDGKMVLISTDKDEEGKQGGERMLPLDCVIKEELLNKDGTEKMDTSQGPGMGGITDSDEITVGSLVQFQGKTLLYGIVRWIGCLPNFPGMTAGLELEDSSAGVTDGTYKGKRYFNCPPHCGLFVKLSSCRPDDRFSGVKKKLFNGHSDNDEAMVSEEQDNVPPIRTEDVSNRLIGKMKGIQGHCNSCYMDSALFSVFSCSSVLDSLLFKTTEYETIQSILLKSIVNPLRKQGFVSEHSVMNLRKQLQKREHCPTYTTDEKDPEEFLSLIMQEILFLDPPLILCSQSGSIQKVQSCYYYQIFMDYNHHLVLPTVQQLLEHSFYSNSLKLAEVPACLILTMPRSGKSFKMFPKIIPSTELDITGLLANGPQQCVLCGQLANQECAECFRDTVFSDRGFKYFCLKCSAQVHSHQQRRCHKPSTLRLPQGFSCSQISGSDRRTPPREKLELFAVLCIETSHYVSFVKYGPQDTDWIFFDSMADRVGESDGYNIPEVRACPEVGQYLHMPLAQLANQVPREMEGVAKRLFCDGYMYLYQSKTMCLYR
ncbi:ubiquitin carboxyl-terminal hydrolase CYLD [Sinocyclocheilus grahami]|uniref:ubiquitinyl hydrolase 1 n=1 Tax=Sinocyclocheilus grahami TaxID=75366 RepID=A0A672T154_SINGR|nr:PREDICTED: ubiquitin carboxyl-terminal hydrolase CYLD-like [Sinocyclocheilus grahami]XP_016095755.1 PREDICTED: ubiquitin carboxyl-terminal hydrolase CYLD-like [Sinocyclocheilus grahami]XP_016095756.1 PREDICTED: ubiquitin carboxyl-terminal hydrolase CYLD-like [Sinocyclocheilus grahami]